jgi:hypothetical protein
MSNSIAMIRGQRILKGRNMTYHGVIRGTIIELDEPPSLPDGQAVTIEIHPFRPGDGIRASAGAWADAGPELDEWLKRMNDARQFGRSIPLP